MRADAPNNLTPDERFSEIAAILARGVLRLRRRCPLSTAEAAEKSDTDPLDVPAKTVLNVHSG